MRKPDKWITGVERIVLSIDRDGVFVYAGQAALMTLISVFPLVMLLVSFIQYVLPLDEAHVIEWLKSVLPIGSVGFAETVVEELFNRPTVSLISVTAVTTLWTASRGVNAIKNGLRRMYRTSVNRGFVYNTAMSLFYTVALLVTILTTLFLLVFGRSLFFLLKEQLPWLVNVEMLFNHVRSLFSLAALTLFFMVIYRTLPGQKLSFLRQFPGALFAALGWVLFSLAFSIYINNFGRYSYVYGSLTAVVLVMLWLYTCMAILLIGAEINAYLLLHMPKKVIPQSRRVAKKLPETPEITTPSEKSPLE